VAIGGLAALGVESLIRRPPGRWRIAAAAGLAAAVFAGIAWFAVSHGFNPAASLRRWVIEVVRLGVLAAILLVVLVLRARGRISGSAAGALAVALLALELVPLAFHRRFQRHDVWTDPPDYVRFLQSDPNPGRVHSVHDLALTANVFQGLGLSGISSRSTFNAPRYVDLLRRYFPTSGIIFPIPTALLPNRRGVLDLLGVKSLIVFSQTAAGDRELKAAGLEWAHKDGEFEVYRNPTAWPRAYLTSSWSGASDPAVALEAVGKLESPDRVVLERRPLFVAGGDPAGPAGKCEIVEDGGDDLTIRTRADRPAILVLQDSFAPGWNATVNGRPAEILAANYAFRAVQVPAGTALVRFRYLPPGLAAGGAVSLAALATVVLLFAWPARGRDSGLSAAAPPNRP
jgi:hypothetical protein